MKLSKKTNGPLRSPMTGFEAQSDHRMPSTDGTTEMVSDPRVSKTGAKIQSPQMPFSIKSGSGDKK